MQVDVRPVARLRGPGAVDVQATLGPILAAVSTTTVDLARLRVVCDWIQYRNSFREPVACRPVLAGHHRAQAQRQGQGAAQLRRAGARSAAFSGTTGEVGVAERGADGVGLLVGAPAGEEACEDGLELAVDLRRCPDIDVARQVREVLAARGDGGLGGVALEPWVPGRQSCIWRFNSLYWQALEAWELATGRAYEQALPGGVSDARNVEAARELVGELFEVWDRLDARGALPDELYVVELGVGNGSQARTWLDAFAELDKARGGCYYPRLRYLMGDYSAHVLERAQRAVAHHAERVSALVLDATRPAATLGFLRGKAFLVYLSNLYDNLPTDEVASIGGRTYLVEVQAFLPREAARRLARRFRAAPERLGALTERLLRLGPALLGEALPQHFPEPGDGVAFWREVWGALRLRERYTPLGDLDRYAVTPSLTGEVLRPLLGAGGDVRLHVSDGALRSFVETLPLLHPSGRLTCHDLFVTERWQYRTGFYGPGKYDGSVVNWVNGPLLELVADQLGFEVRFTPFKQRPSANIKTLTATPRV